MRWKHFRILPFLIVLTLLASEASGQMRMQELLPKPPPIVPTQGVAPPEPQRLSPDWWQYFAGAGETLEARIEETRERLQKLIVELDAVQGRKSALGLVEQLDTALSAYGELRARPPPTPGVLPPALEQVDIHGFLALDQRLRDLRREVAVIAHDVNRLQETIDIGKRELDAERIAYLGLSGTSQDPLEAGLKLMRDRLRLELAREELRRRRETHSLREEELERLAQMVADAADRLEVSAEDARNFEQRSQAAQNRALELEGELARMALERNYGTPESAADQAASRLQQITSAETEVRRARAQTEAALYATAAALPGGEGNPGADAAGLRKVLEVAQGVRLSAAARLSDWQGFLQTERDDAMRELATVGGSSGAQGSVNRARLQAADTMSEGLAGLAQSVQDLQRVIDVATAHLVDMEGLVWGSLAEVRAFSSHALAALSDWFSAGLFEVGNTPVTPVGLTRVILIIAVTLVISRLMRRALDRMRSRREGGSQAALYTLSRMLHYLLLILGTVVALSSIGIDFTKFALFATALGVGIGFGLQTLISNFVAGIIILFERSLKVGDFIELESGVQGEVKEINIRSTLVNTNENIDIVVPNAELIGSRVVNWTMQAPHRRIHLPFPVAFGADRELVRKAGLEATSEVPFTMGDTTHKPQVWLVGFDDDRMKFELVVWLVPGAVKRPQAVSAAYYWALAGALDRHGIALPFPQRDLHLKSYYGLTGGDAVEAATGRARKETLPPVSGPYVKEGGS